MTSEIVLMNRYAVALAADSAVTVNYWRDGSRKERYFKGANKIFNLSSAQPIALMIAGNAAVQGMPWEIVSKAYRDYLGPGSHDTVSAYATDFFKFLAENEDIFPLDQRVEQFLSDAETSALFLVYLVDINDAVSSEKNQETRKNIAAERWEEVKGRLGRANYIGDCTEEDTRSAYEAQATAIKTRLDQNNIIAKFRDVIPVGELYEMCVEALFRKGLSILGETGVVITGFGIKEYFAKMRSYRHYGMVLGRMICECSDTREIGQSNTSDIIPFAQSEMVKTFVNGISAGALRQVGATFLDTIEVLEGGLKGDGIIAAEADISVQRNAARNAFENQLTKEMMSAHTEPMKRVVGMLPIQELAELAEILIRIESLKERVTRESEQVGGPIDVAVISKGDGFIWIKRKHYFDRALNLGYVARKGVQNHAPEDTGGEVRRGEPEAGGG